MVPHHARRSRATIRLASHLGDPPATPLSKAFFARFAPGNLPQEPTHPAPTRPQPRPRPRMRTSPRRSVRTPINFSPSSRGTRPPTAHSESSSTQGPWDPGERGRFDVELGSGDSGVSRERSVALGVPRLWRPSTRPRAIGERMITFVYPYVYQPLPISYSFRENAGLG